VSVVGALPGRGDAVSVVGRGQGGAVRGGYSALTYSVWRRTIGKREPSGLSSVPCDDNCAMEMAHGHGMVLKIGVIVLLPTPIISIRQRFGKVFDRVPAGDMTQNLCGIDLCGIECGVNNAML
jgi:hypothetical protein